MVCKDRTVSGGAGPQDNAFCHLQIPSSEIHRVEVHGGQAEGDGQDSQVVPGEEHPTELWDVLRGMEKAKGPSMGRGNDQEFKGVRIKTEDPRGLSF